MLATDHMRKSLSKMEREGVGDGAGMTERRCKEEDRKEGKEASRKKREGQSENGGAKMKGREGGMKEGRFSRKGSTLIDKKVGLEMEAGRKHGEDGKVKMLRMMERGT